MTIPYKERGNYLKTFLYFMAVEFPVVGWKGSLPFHYNGIEFDLRPMEWHLMEAILLNEEYGLVAHAFKGQTPAVIIDAGANVGMFSVYALTTWPTAKILAVEPGPDTFKILERNQRKNPTFDWRVLPYAFWKEDGSIYFENDGLSMAAHISNTASSVKVPTIRLDHFLDEYLSHGERVSILKMDIEGAEEAVLTTAPGVLSRVDVMVIEVHSGMCNDQLVRDILKQEFEFVYDLSSPSTEYPVMLACRKALETFNT